MTGRDLDARAAAFAAGVAAESAAGLVRLSAAGVLAGIGVLVVRCCWWALGI